ncbi:cell cycle checkpoint protein RAD17 [Paramormyrops kingsleyae]|uniref:cell cycle checkpoint protein RAD17 n=1 Tax=Paramormyrops kingsleyae TaxID=1676925 RepID=UPI003B978412
MSKLSIERKPSSSKGNSWVEPAFGDLFGGSERNLLSTRKTTNARECRKRPTSSSKQPLKRKGTSQSRESENALRKDQQCQDEPWVDKYCPHTQADLAVHPKKMKEVESWLKSHIDSSVQNTGGAILLLTGPSGCGKTATIRVLARELDCLIQEWSNPSTFSEFKTEESFRQSFDPESRFNSFSGGSQTVLFQEFLLRANKYSPLQMLGGCQTGNKKLILIEDFPNQFYRQPECLHGILRSFVKTGKCPLLLIVSDSLSGDGGSRQLFPKEHQEELGICHISFNPVAPTNIMKVLNRIVTQEASGSGGRIMVPDKETLELLCTGSSGDIRGAINNLQFLSLTDCSVQSSFWAPLKNKPVSASSSRSVSKGRSRSKSTKSSDKQDAQSQAIGGKDASLFLFRALGKILYCKRESYSEPELPKLPAHLSEHRRDRLLVDPELVVEKSHMSAELFNLYLHQNYVDFFADMEDVARASEYLSDADFLTTDWTSRCTMREYSSSVATRGLMHANAARASTVTQTCTGFRPLHKPHWLLVSKKYRENCQAAKSLFVSFCLTPFSLQTELLPYLAQLTNPMRNQAQIAFIQDVGRMPLTRHHGRLKFEALTDKEPGLLDLESDEEDATLPAAVTDLGLAEPLTAATDSPGELPSSQGASTDLPPSQPQPTGAQALLDEEEFVIEEYDSD